MKRAAISILLLGMALASNAQDNRVTRLQGLESVNTQQQDFKQFATLNKASRLFGSEYDLTSVITVIPAGDTVAVTGADSTFLHVVYQDTEGYIMSRHATMMNTGNNNTGVVSQQQGYQTGGPVQQQQTSRFTYLENKYGTSMAARLISGKIWKGMTADMVQDSWGSPRKINRTYNGNDIKETWDYSTTWLYFINSLLTEWGPEK
jgi:hypothetical protein